MTMACMEYLVYIDKVTGAKVILSCQSSAAGMPAGGKWSSCFVDSTGLVPMSLGWCELLDPVTEATYYI